MGQASIGAVPVRQSLRASRPNRTPKGGPRGIKEKEQKDKYQKKKIEKKNKQKNYGTRDSRMVTHCSTNLAIPRLTRAERTGSRVFMVL